MYLGSECVADEVARAFIAAIQQASLGVVRSVAAMRGTAPDRISKSSILAEVVRLLPQDLFKTCLERVPPPPSPTLDSSLAACIPA